MTCPNVGRIRRGAVRPDRAYAAGHRCLSALDSLRTKSEHSAPMSQEGRVSARRIGARSVPAAAPGTSRISEADEITDFGIWSAPPARYCEANVELVVVVDRVNRGARDGVDRRRGAVGGQLMRGGCGNCAECYSPQTGAVITLCFGEVLEPIQEDVELDESVVIP